eukprot:gene3517-111_t
MLLSLLPPCCSLAAAAPRCAQDGDGWVAHAWRRPNTSAGPTPAVEWMVAAFDGTDLGSPGGPYGRFGKWPPHTER